VFSTVRAVSTSPSRPISGSTRQLAIANTSHGSSPSSQRARSRSWMVKSLNRPPLVGMKPGGGAAGSWLTSCSDSSRPMSPASTRALSARKCGSKRRLKPSTKRAPANSGCAARTLPRSRSMGFSQNTALPARTAACACARCWSVELQTSTPRVAGSASASSSPATCAFHSVARAAATSARGSTTYFRRSPGCAAALAPCTWPMRPAPIRATSIRSTMAPLGWLFGKYVPFYSLMEHPAQSRCNRPDSGPYDPSSKERPMAEQIAPPATAEALRAAILARYETLSKRLQQIARYVLDEPNAIALETLAVLAERTGVQPSAIVRFAKTFGFEGATQMQRLFRDGLLSANASLGYGERIREFAKAVDG